MKYLVTRVRASDEVARPREFYVGNLEEGGAVWSGDRTKAKPFDGAAASVLCENLSTRNGGYHFSFVTTGRA